MRPVADTAIEPPSLIRTDWRRRIPLGPPGGCDAVSVPRPPLRCSDCLYGRHEGLDTGPGKPGKPDRFSWRFYQPRERSNLEPEKALGLIALAWLIGAILLAARSIRKGRALVSTLAARHPETCEARGRPQPGYLHSARRSRFTRVPGRREYDRLDDPAVVARFARHRTAEARLALLLLGHRPLRVCSLVAPCHPALFCENSAYPNFKTRS